MGLIIMRKLGEGVVIGNKLIMRVIEISPTQVTLIFEGGKKLKIDRLEHFMEDVFSKLEEKETGN